MDENATYKAAGVDVEAGEEAVRRIKSHVHSTYNENVLTDLGSFGGMFKLPCMGMEEPVLVSSIDGVGTKVKIASMMDKYDTIGMDIVNHCCDDILVQGAMPLFFLDYFATNKLKPAILEQIVIGMSQACRENGCVLIGGETAEMPGVYLDGEFDIAGSIVGIVDRNKIIDGSKVSAGDAVIGIASNGLHTNGFSLVRKILFEDHDYKATDYVPEIGGILGDALLAPHRSYVKPIAAIMQEFDIHAMAHLTGGGFYSNIPRVLPSECQVVIERLSWVVPPLFGFIQDKGGIETTEMHKTFNMGIGLVLIVPRQHSISIIDRLTELGEHACMIGEVHTGAKEVMVI